MGILAFALVAGAVAAVNPCGFALLPAYLGMLVSNETPGGVLRAVRFAVGMTVGFALVFGAFGLALASLAGPLERYLPVVTIVMGLALVGLGLWLVTGHHLSVPGLVGHGSAPTTRWTSQLGYGVSFALVSLSCTVGPFLAVTGSALRSGGAFDVVVAFLAYAVGMGIVVLILAVAVVTARTSLVRILRRAGAGVDRFSGALLVLAGGYVAWYGWFELRVLAGRATSDPVVGAAIQVQATVTRWISAVGPGALLGVGAVAVAVVAAALLRGRRRRPVG